MEISASGNCERNKVMPIQRSESKLCMVAFRPVCLGRPHAIQLLLSCKAFAANTSFKSENCNLSFITQNPFLGTLPIWYINQEQFVF